MNIDRYNCEAVFLDYYEENLSPVEVAEMLFFLEEHPDIKGLFESYEYIFLTTEKINFPNKEMLKNKYSRTEIEAILSSEINKSNCVLFFVAASEGLLKEDQIRKLDSFIAGTPELRKDFELFQKCKLAGEKILFEDKALLKKQPVLQTHTGITLQNREEYFIRAAEKELNPAEQEELALFLQKNPGYKNEFELFKKAILVPEQIAFQGKASLKKKERKPVFIPLFNQRTFTYSTAAAILFLVGVFLFYSSNDNTPVYVAATTSSLNSDASTDKKNILTAEENKSESLQENTQNEIPHETKKDLADEIASALLFVEEDNSHTLQLIAQEEKRHLQSTITDTTATVLAEIGNEENEQKTEAIIAENSKKETTDSIVVLGSPIVASAAGTQKEEDKYETIANVVNKKLRSVLGIKNTSDCKTSEKIGLWELAMAAKNGIQKVTGTKAVEVKKVCDSTGDKVEYIFAAGKFEISKSTSK